MQKDNEKVRMSFSEEYKAILLRTEKITSAVYLLADFINFDDVVVKNLKDTSSSLVSAILAEDEGWRVRSVLIARKIVFYVSIANGVGYITDRTSLLLKSEIDKLIETLSVHLYRFDDGSVRREERLKSMNRFENALERAITDAHSNVFLKTSTTPSRSEYFKKSDSDYLKDISRTKKDKRAEIPVLASSNILQSGNPPIRHGESTGDRKTAIIEVLRKSDNLTVKDFSSFIHDCSEKTIQRDLAALVATGVVSRKGERRWTRYSLAGTLSS
jgi:DNA-binding transcriptional ArsR family regulator